MKKYLFLALALVSINTLATAQFIEFAPSYNPLLAPITQEEHLDTRGEGDTLSLPFMDDFSYIDTHVPSEQYWCDRSVYVNTTLAVNPPSIGVATMDGLNSAGTPYGVQGAGDTLTSKPFFLGNYTPSSNVYLSFYYQAKGKGDRPLTADSLILEYKKTDDTWISIQNWAGINPSQPSTYVPDFQFQAFAIPSEYLYDGFQFRFRNLSSGTGQVDLWHIDYIRLTEGVVPTEKFTDVAFVEIAPTFLKNYTSMPWRQYQGFEEQETTNEYTLTLFNHFPDVQEIQNRIANILEVNQSSSVMIANFLTDADAPIPLGNVNPGTPIKATKTWNDNTYSNFINAMQTQFTGAEELVFQTVFSYTQTGQNSAFSATLANDVTARKTVFSNYLAYDDGSAESNVKAQNPGTDVAVKFHLNTADTLKAIRMHIPHIYNDVSNQLFNLKVYSDLNAEPIYTAIYQSPDYVDEYTNTDTLQGFTTYVLKNETGEAAPLLLNAGDFYIGWEQVSETDFPIPIGLDKNNPQATAHNFYDVGAGWQPFSSTLQGAIMIRPVLGNAIVSDTGNEELITAETAFHIYPNPTNDRLFIQSKKQEDFKGEISIYNLLGKKVKSLAYQNSISLGTLPQGVYFLQIVDEKTGQAYQQRVVVE